MLITTTSWSTSPPTRGTLRTPSARRRTHERGSEGAGRVDVWLLPREHRGTSREAQRPGVPARDHRRRSRAARLGARALHRRGRHRQGDRPATARSVGATGVRARRRPRGREARQAIAVDSQRGPHNRSRDRARLVVGRARLGRRPHDCGGPHGGDEPGQLRPVRARADQRADQGGACCEARSRGAAWSTPASEAGCRAADRVGPQQRVELREDRNRLGSRGHPQPSGPAKLAAIDRAPHLRERHGRNRTGGRLIPYIRAHNTAIKRKGKVVKRYEVVWREPATDPTTGLPTGKQRSRQESYPTRELAEARRDELNNAKHNVGGTAALADAKKAGELPFAHYAAGFVARQQSKVAAGKLKARTCERYEGTIKAHLLPVFGAKAVGAITVTDCEQFRANLLANRRPRTVRNVCRC